MTLPALRKAASLVDTSQMDVLARAASHSRDREAQSGDGIPYINYSGKRSVYAIGKDKQPMDPERLFLVDIRQSREGWVLWKGGTVQKRHEWPSHQPEKEVLFADLDDPGPLGEGDGWMAEKTFGVVDVDDTTFVARFSTNSASGRNSVADLMTEVNARLKPEGPNGRNATPEDPCFPVIQFHDQQFQANGQWNGKPVFPVVEWLSLVEVTAMEQGLATYDQILDGQLEGIDDETPEPEPDSQPEPDSEPEPRPRARQAPQEAEEASAGVKGARTRSRRSAAAEQPAEEAPAPATSTRRRRRR